jgi:hypothetical protein
MQQDGKLLVVDRNTNDGVETHFMVYCERIGLKLAAGDAIGEVQSIAASRTPTAFGGLSIPQYTDPTPRRLRL